jgi:hypothetical protein
LPDDFEQLFPQHTWFETHQMTSLPHHGRRERLLTAIMVALVLFKLWLVGAQTLQAVGFSGHDDRLFLRMTATILDGRWLGDYNQMTLAKGPFFSMFAAVAFVLGVPLMTAQHVAYALACGLIIRALRPLAFGTFMRAGLFAALLFNPATYHTGRVLRQNITPALSLFILAAVIALHLRRKEPTRRLIPWAAILGASLSAFSLMREDGIWIAPALLLPLSGTAWLMWRDTKAKCLPKLGALTLIPVSLYAAGVLSVCALNWHYYGVFTTCEFRHPAFKAAYGALTRVKPAHWQPLIPVARETRERIYAVSPAFAELRPELEGQLGINWATNSQSVTGRPPEDREIAGGWFVWALRDAVVAAGHAHTGSEAMAFYARIADEVNKACDQGLIEAGPPRTGFLSPWNAGYAADLFASVKHAAGLVITFNNLGVIPRASSGTPQSLVLFADLTHERLSPIEGEVSPLIRQATLDKVRLSILMPIGKAYSWVMPWLVAGAFFAGLTGSIRELRQRNLPYWGLFSAGLLGACSALVLICALVNTTSFPAIYPTYLVGAYGCLILFVFSSMWSAKKSPGAT